MPKEDYAPLLDGHQAVAPTLRRRDEGNWRFGRAGTLIACCGAAVLVALVGTIDNAATPPTSPVLAMKASLVAVPTDHAPSKAEVSHKNLAASAHSLLDTANGIIQDAKLHATDFPVSSSSSSLAPYGREMQLTFAPQSSSRSTLAPLLKSMEGGQKLAEENTTSTEDDDEKETHPKVLGATGKDVFGSKNSSMVGFLGFSKHEPSVLGVPLPIVMFLCVTCAAVSVIAVGCYCARTTDILKVNKEEVGAPAKPVDDVEDTRGRYWEDLNKGDDKT